VLDDPEKIVRISPGDVIFLCHENHLVAVHSAIEQDMD
jgi:hypothetical protein